MLALTRRLGQQSLQGQALQTAGALPALLSRLEQLLQVQAGRPYGDGHRPSTPAAVASGVGEAFQEPQPVLRLPSLDVISQLNPQLYDAMLQHHSVQRSASVLEVLLAAIEEANPDAKRAPRLTKSGLGSLRVDRLRGLLQQLSADSRGTKAVLVQRLLEIGSSVQREQEEEENQQGQQAAVARAAARIKDGVVSRREVAAQQAVAQRLAAAAKRGGYGVPEASLRQAHRDMVQQAGFRQVFTPDEVADIFAEARADDIAIIDVREHCPFTDWMVLGTARSQRLASMMAAAVLHQLKARAQEVAPGVTPNIEGSLTDSEWLVVDAGNVVAHVFVEGYRQEYALEKLWGTSNGANIRRIAPKQTVHTLDSLQ